MKKFDKIILDNFVKQTGEPSHWFTEQAPGEPVAEPPMDPAAAPAVAPPEPVAPEPESVPDEPMIKLSLIDLAKKALFVDPDTIDQKTKGMLSKEIDQNNVGELEQIISDIVSIETDVDTGGIEIDYNNTL
jgi:hypothetical protein